MIRSGTGGVPDVPATADIQAARLLLAPVQSSPPLLQPCQFAGRG